MDNQQTKAGSFSHGFLPKILNNCFHILTIKWLTLLKMKCYYLFYNAIQKGLFCGPNFMEFS
jgi:hypothetical protein